MLDNIGIPLSDSQHLALWTPAILYSIRIDPSHISKPILFAAVAARSKDTSWQLTDSVPLVLAIRALANLVQVVLGLVLLDSSHLEAWVVLIVPALTVGH